MDNMEERNQKANNVENSHFLPRSMQGCKYVIWYSTLRTILQKNVRILLLLSSSSSSLLLLRFGCHTQLCSGLIPVIELRDHSWCSTRNQVQVCCLPASTLTAVLLLWIKIFILSKKKILKVVRNLKWAARLASGGVRIQIQCPVVFSLLCYVSCML